MLIRAQLESTTTVDKKNSCLLTLIHLYFETKLNDYVDMKFLAY